MNMAEGLKTVGEIARTLAPFPSSQAIERWKAQGGKVIGWLCIYVPEEIIHAAGMLPVRVLGDGQELALEDANAYLYINACSFSRSCMQLALDGRYAYLDGFVGAHMCDSTRRLIEVWKTYHQSPFVHVITVPRKTHQRAQIYYLAQLRSLVQKLESFFHIRISDEALQSSIHLYNRSRQLFKQLAELRKADPPCISGAEIMQLMNGGFRMPREEFNQVLEATLHEAIHSQRTLACKARILVAGSILNNVDFIKTIEDLGGLVVADELCTGMRYGMTPVDTSLEPYEAIARRYLAIPPCARMVRVEERIRNMMDMIREFRIDGVVCEVIRFCASYAHEQPLIRQALEAAGTPVLELDVEYGASGTGQIRTRVQAFLEMCQAVRRQ